VKEGTCGGTGRHPGTDPTHAMLTDACRSLGIGLDRQTMG